MTELVINALKHAFPEPRSGIIEARARKLSAIVAVSDADPGTKVTIAYPGRYRGEAARAASGLIAI